MRILVISNLYPPEIVGGYELGCSQAVDALRDRGHDVRVLTSTSAGAPGDTGTLRRLRLVNIFNTELHWCSADAAYRQHRVEGNLVSAHNVHVLLDALDEVAPDVVYAWNLVGLGGIGLLMALRQVAMPVVWHLMDDVPDVLCSIGNYPDRRLGRLLAEGLDGRAIACSQGLVDEIAMSGVSLDGRVDIIPNWITGPVHQVDRGYFDGGTLRMVFAGSVYSHKGVDILVDMVALLRARGLTQVVLDLVGTGDIARYDAMIEQRGVRDQVRFLGWRPQADLFASYAKYDVFLFPTAEREPFGFAPLEAVSRGLVPLVTDTCGIAEWLVDGVHLLKAERTAEAFADVIERVLTADIDLEPIGRRGAAVLWRDFHILSVVGLIEAALDAEARRPQRPRTPARDVRRLATLGEELARRIVREQF